MTDRRSGNGPGGPVLTVTRLLQNPLGQLAPPGVQGDLLCISDGTSKIYLMPAEYDALIKAELRWRLAEQPLED